MTHSAQVATPDFRALFEAAPARMMALATDSQFTIIAATDAYLRAALIRREDVVGRGLFEVIPDNPDDPSVAGAAGLRASLQRALRDRRPDAMPIHRYDIPGSAAEGGGFEERYWSTTNYPLLAADGTCTCIIHRVEDVTEFVRMGQQRQEQSRPTDDPRHQQAECDSLSGLHAHLGRLSLLQQITRAIGDRQDYPSICQVVLRTLEDQMSLDFACMGQYVESRRQLVVTGLGLKGAELVLSATLEDAQHIDLGAEGLDRCLKGHLVYDPDLSRVDSPFARRLVGSGLRSMVAVPVRLENQTFGVLLAARREADSFNSSECEFLAQLAEHVALAANNLKLYSSLHEAYEDLRSTQQAAMQQERLRALGEMASGIAHDINNSITPAALYLDSLLEKADALPAGMADRLQTIQRAVSDVAATVSRMREFYRQRESRQAFAPVQLNELVRHVVEMTRARWSDMPLQRGIAIDMRTELASRLPAVMGVDHELREALINLLFNAVDAMPQGGALVVRTRQDEDGRIAVEVSDTGVGMSEEARRRCLEPFYTTKGERGTGLGLAMVFGAAQRHGAEIDIVSAPGEGTTIRLTFTALSETGAAPPVASTAVPKPRRILIIDDDPVLLRSLQEALLIDGHSVVMASGGEEGIERFRAALPGSQPYDLVFTDLGMPYVDGRQVAATVKALSPATPVIMLTGWGRHMQEDGEAPAHVDRLLGKPPRLRDLRAAIVGLTG